MTKGPLRRGILIASLALAGTALSGARPAAAQSDPCAVPVTLPTGGFAVNNLAQPNTEWATLQFARYADASYACVSNYPNFPPPDPQMGALFYCYPLSGNGNDIVNQWTLLPGYSKVVDIYVQYNRCPVPQPESVNPIVIVETSNWPAKCDAPVVSPAYTPPATDGFAVSVVGGSNVTSANIQLQATPGSSNLVEVSSNSDFSNSQTIDLCAGFCNPFPWTLPGYGLNQKIYARFLNDCGVLPTRTIVVSVNYPNPVCTSSINTNGLMITSQGPTNVRLGYPTRVTLVPHGNNANWVQISDSFNFANSSWYKISDNPTISHNLPAGTGNKTVWAMYWYKNNGCVDVKAPYAVSISFAVTR